MTLRCVRSLLLGVCSLLVVGPGEGARLVEGRLGGSVELPCQRRPLDHPMEELLVYWQRERGGDAITVAALVHGKVESSYQDGRYAGRAAFCPSGIGDGDFTLRLWSLRLEDSGQFVCFIYWNRGSTQTLPETHITLRVTAEFSTPIIVSAMPGEVSYGQELTLTCTAYGGTRPPQIVWVNSSDGTPMHQGCIHSNYPRQEDFINLTCTITINITSSTNISCTLLTLRGNLTSHPYALVLSGDGGQTDRQLGPSSALRVALPVVLLVAGLAVLAVMVKGRVGCPSGDCRRANYQSGMTEETETGV